MPKPFVIVESLFGFVPVILLWLLLVYGLVAAIPNVQYEYLLGFSAYCLIVFLGGVGLYGAYKLARRLLQPKQYFPKPAALKILLLIGILNASVNAYLLSNIYTDAVFALILPILVSLHFVYLDRQYLWKGRHCRAVRQKN